MRSMVEKKISKPTPKPAAQKPVPPPPPIPAPEVKAPPKFTPTFLPPEAPSVASGPKFPGAPGFLKDFDFSKLFSEMKVPALPDMEAVLATHKRNLEALSDANKVALEGAQAVARRHMEIMQSTVAEITDSLKSLSVAEAPAARAAK